MVYRIMIVVGLIIIGIGFLYKALYMRIKSNAAKNWPMTKGKILSSDILEDNLRNITGKATTVYFTAVVYEYMANGQTLKGNRLTFGNPSYDYMTASRIRDKYPADSEVNVYYNPVKPVESVLVPFAREAMRSYIPGVFFIISGILIAVIIFVYR